MIDITDLIDESASTDRTVHADVNTRTLELDIDYVPIPGSDIDPPEELVVDDDTGVVTDPDGRTYHDAEFAIRECGLIWVTDSYGVPDTGPL